MATNKNVIEFIKHACPTVLDLTEDNIKIIEKDKDIMSILKRDCNSLERDYGDAVGVNTSLDAYRSMGWYLAEILRNDIQNYYRLKHGITMQQFLSMKNGDKLPECMDSEFSKNLRIQEFKKLFGKELKI